VRARSIATVSMTSDLASGGVPTFALYAKKNLLTTCKEVSTTI
jgi:hypothetical protein